MPVDPSKVCLFIPGNLKKFKLALFNRIGDHITALGGKVARTFPGLLKSLPDDIIPIVGCHPEQRPNIDDWIARRRAFIYWDRGYCRRIFATWLPRGQDGGYYRWHLNAFQLRRIRTDLPDDRWRGLQTHLSAWSKGGRHIVIAAPTLTYTAFHRTERWTDATVDKLSRVTDRPLVIRGKESKRPLHEDLKDAHALVAHQSNAAVEACIMGCPAFVDGGSAAALLGNTDLEKIEKPVYADRDHWLRSLSYSQFNERELVDGTLWGLLA